MSSGFRDKISERVSGSLTEHRPTVVPAGGAWGALPLTFAVLAAVIGVYFVLSGVFGSSERPGQAVDARVGREGLHAPLAEQITNFLDPWATWEKLRSVMHRLGIGDVRPPEQASTVPRQVQTTTEYPWPAPDKEPYMVKTTPAARRDPWTFDPRNVGPPFDLATPEGRARVETARRKTIVDLPPRAWVQVRPELLRDVDPARLLAEGGALVVVRAYLETSDHAFAGIPPNISLRDVSTGFMRIIYIRWGGPAEGQGWGVGVLPPGRYVPVGAPIGSRLHIMKDGTLFQETALPRGSVDVPADKAVTINAGDVLYTGSEIGIVSKLGSRPMRVEVRDDSDAAAAWARAELPKFAPYLKTRLVTPLPRTQ